MPPSAGAFGLTRLIVQTSLVLRLPLGKILCRGTKAKIMIFQPLARPYLSVCSAFLFLSTLSFGGDLIGRTNDKAAAIASPPVAAVRPVTDEYFGVKVVDPYRYLEDLKNPEVAAWFKGQNDYTRAVLARIPGRDDLLARIKMLDESAPARVSDLRRLPGNRYFYQKRLASEDVSKLYSRDGLNGEERLLVDPAKFLKPGGPHYVISYYAPQPFFYVQQAAEANACVRAY
jgi:hypothetical protein